MNLWDYMKPIPKGYVDDYTYGAGLVGDRFTTDHGEADCALACCGSDGMYPDALPMARVVVGVWEWWREVENVAELESVFRTLSPHPSPEELRDAGFSPNDS